MFKSLKLWNWSINLLTIGRKLGVFAINFVVSDVSNVDESLVVVFALVVVVFKIVENEIASLKK